MTMWTNNTTYIADLNAAMPANGQFKFPATQNASSDANTLDDYEESNSWTPVLTFATPGNLSVAYTTQVGEYTKIGRIVVLNFAIVTSSFTHTTASGGCRITGLPFTSGTTSLSGWVGKLQWQGITKANYTEVHARINSATTIISLLASGSGQSTTTVDAADMPTAGSVLLTGEVTFRV